MSDLRFPTSGELEIWFGLISESLSDYLPPYNPKWSEYMLSCFHVAAIAARSGDLVETGARVFYKIAKNHYLVDGNKRSAVICTYLFFLQNGYQLSVLPETLYELARLTANSQIDSEDAVRTLKNAFFQRMKLAK